MCLSLSNVFTLIQDWVRNQRVRAHCGESVAWLLCVYTSYDKVYKILLHSAAKCHTLVESHLKVHYRSLMFYLGRPLYRWHCGCHRNHSLGRVLCQTVDSLQLKMIIIYKINLIHLQKWEYVIYILKVNANLDCSWKYYIFFWWHQLKFVIK